MNSLNVRKRDMEVYKSGGVPSPPQPSESGGYVSLEKIINFYDIKASIKREIDNLPKGQLLPESEFIQRTAGSDRNRFRRTVENNAEEFKPFRIKLRIDGSADGRWYWGRSFDIAKALLIRDQ
jgi:hypothetical protein